MGKSSDNPAAAARDLPFEKAIGRVEEIVARMEGERLPLEELIASYDEGTQLLEVCRQRLDEAQRKIDLISVAADGTVEVSSFEPDELPTAEEGTARSRPRS